MLFDSHAHLEDSCFNEDRQEVIQKANEAGVTGFLVPGTDMSSSEKAVEIANQFPNMYAAVGVHPHDAKTVFESDYYKLAEWAKHSKVVAIGEIGLDYFYDHSLRDIQRTVFLAHIDLAKQLHLPIIIHDREAHQDTLEILKKEAKGLIGVCHCYSGSYEMAQELLKMGFSLGIGGTLTFKNSKRIREIATRIPLERILLETDCPYLTPEPHRGKRNEPAYVALVAAELALLRKTSVSEIAKQTTMNVKELFSL